MPCQSPARTPLDAAARNQLVEANLGLVRAIARDYARRGVDEEDLYQEGVLGLMRAAELFDESIDGSFAGYASPWIRGEIRFAIRKSGLVRLPDHIAKRQKGLRPATISAENDRAPLDSVADPKAEDPADRLRRGELSWAAYHAILKLPRREMVAVVWYHGLDGGSAKNEFHIAAELRVSVEEARRAIQDGVARLRAILAAHDPRRDA